MRRIPGLLIVAFALVHAALAATAASPQGEPVTEGQGAEESTPVPSASKRQELPPKVDVEAKLAEWKALPPDAPNRDELVLAYEVALNAIRGIEELREQRRELAIKAAGAKDKVPLLEAAVAEPRGGPPDLAAELKGKTVEDIDRLVSEAALVAEELRRESDGLQVELRESSDRRLGIAERRSEVELALAAPRDATSDGEGGALADARSLAALARRVQLEEELRTLTDRESTFDARLDLLRAETAWARIEADEASARREALEEALNAKRAAEALLLESEANKALNEASMETTAFEKIAEATVAIRSGNLDVAQRQQKLSNRRQKIEDKIKDFTARFQETKDRVKEPALARANGLRLRGELRDIAKERALELAAPDVEGDLAEAQVKLSQVGQKLEALRAGRGWIEDAVEAATAEGQAEEDARTLAKKTRSEYIEALQDSAKALGAEIEVLGALSVKRAELARMLKEYDAFVIERVLWIRSSAPAWRIRASDIEREARDALALGPWRAIKDSVRDGGRLSTRPIASLVALLVLFGARRRLRRALQEEGELAGQRTQVSIAPTLRALVLSALIAAPYGALLYGIGIFLTQLEVDAEHASYVLALADGCCRAAIPLWLIGAMRVLVRKEGLAEAHFRWTEEATKLVRRNTVWLFAIAPAAAFLAEFFAGISGSATGDMDAIFAPLGLESTTGAEGLSRAAFLVDVLACAVFAYRVLHPARGILAINAGKMRSGDLLTRLRRLWFLLLMAALIAFGLVAILGYGYTARSLFSRLVLSVALLVGIFVVRGTALRWIRLELRAEAFEKLRKRREEMRAKRQAEIEVRRSAGEDVEELESEGLEVEDQEVDVATLSSDVLGLVRIVTGFAAVLGVLATCSSVLPALGVFDGVELWQEEVTVAQAVAKDGATEAMQAVTTYEWVTLGNVGVAGLILLLMWLAIRDVPSLLEFMLLRRLNLGSGERYAITTLLRYAITVVGLALAFDELGLSWSKLQWLVAGVSVGLGFGLQEIFANFVSGITLLFERPVRVGDWVTLGEIEGVVSKIRIRATTIRDRDLKELIVPNREFITGRFINWTLSDPVSRVTLNVGVAYGSDTEKAIQLLLEAGRGSTYSVAEPAPNVVFMSFGSSSLDFELRVFVAGREIKPRVVHDLHMRVDAAFREAGIEIAFPQQDVHLRTVPAGQDTGLAT